MKDLNEIIKQKPIFLNIFEDKISVLNEFAGEHYSWDKEKEIEFVKKHENINILFASYGYDNYSGDAWVLFEQDGELFEINGSHCSCYGLEGQWEPERVSLKELKHRLLSGTFGVDDWSDNNFKKELCEFLNIEFEKNEQ